MVTVGNVSKLNHGLPKTFYQEIVLYGIFTILCIAFVLFFKHPLNADVPLHSSMGKAFWDLITGTVNDNYPYALNLQVSSYALPEILVGLFIGVFGSLFGTQLFLILYLILYAWSTNKMVRSLGIDNKSIAYIGFPLAFAYFFHYGFLPFMIGTIFANLSISNSHPQLEKGNLFKLSVLRVLTFLCHPMPVLVVGIHDMVFFWRKDRSSFLQNLIVFTKRMLILWIPSLILLLYMLSFLVKRNDGMGSEFIYGTLAEQLQAVFRGVVIDNHLPGIIMLGLVLLTTFFLILRQKFMYERIRFVLLGMLLVVVSLLIPRQSFMDSWGNAERIGLYSFIVFFACIKPSIKSRKFVQGLVLLMFLYSFITSFIMWQQYARNYNELANFVKNAGFDRIEDVFLPKNYKCISEDGDLWYPVLAHNAAPWMWTLGYVNQTYNMVGVLPYGPVKYIDHNNTDIDDVPVIVTHHNGTCSMESFPQGTVLFNNRIYTVLKAKKYMKYFQITLEK